MGGVLEGFGVITIVIAVGFGVAHVGIVGVDSQVMLTRLVFYVASPALMYTVLADVDVVAVLSSRLVVAVVSFAVTGALAILVARGLWRMSIGDSTITLMCAAYVNSGNLGIPIAVYALGDASAVASVMLFQMVVVSPLCFLALDHDGRDQGAPLWRVLASPFRNPMTVGSILGILEAVVDWDAPTIVVLPVEMIAGMALPAMLIAYGVSLRLGPRPGKGAPARQITVVAVLKVVVQPAVAYVCGLLLGLDGSALMAVTVVAALPTAHQIFVHATRYGHLPVLARDSIFVTTLLSVPAVLLIVALLA